MHRPSISAPRLLLFDIDGTLIHKGGMGSAALKRAFLKLHGLPDALQGMRLDGMTDPDICREVFERNGLVWSETALGPVIEEYLVCLGEEAALRPCGQLCPGVAALLESLSTREDCVLGLLTGNVQGGAELKLRTFGLWERFVLGAYGSDRSRRVELVEVAFGRVEKLRGIRPKPHEAVVIGDTPADIATGRHNGCRSVAVATGRYSVDQLREHGPDHVLHDLADLAQSLDALGLA